jgi:hypothetical protein
MLKLRSLFQRVDSRRDVYLNHVTSAEFAGDIVSFALNYPFPHNILGKEGADRYVLALTDKGSRSAAPSQVDGWYTGSIEDRVCAACYLSIYGIGNGKDHTLWKIRHPMLASPRYKFSLAALLRKISRIALEALPGSAKIVIFLGEREVDAQWAAQKAGFQREACFKDYYRLGEACYVYGLTLVSNGK